MLINICTSDHPDADLIRFPMRRERLEMPAFNAQFYIEPVRNGTEC